MIKTGNDDYMKEAAGKIKKPCGACGKTFSFVDLERTKIKGKNVFACKECVEKEKDRLRERREARKKREKKKKQEKERKTKEENKELTINGDELKTFATEIVMKVKEEISEKLHDELKESVVIPKHPCIEGVMLKLIDKQEVKPYEFDKWRHLYIDETRKLLINLWYADVLRKTQNGWYMINRQKIGYEEFIKLLGYWGKYREVTPEAFDTIIKNTVERSKKNPPRKFEITGDKRIKAIKRGAFERTYDEKIANRIEELLG